jgi:hypothetical protein
MTYAKLLFILMKSLPEILKLIQALEKSLADGQTNRKVADDIKAIHEAFIAKDSGKLNDIFNSR